MGKLTVGLALLIAIKSSLSAGNAWHTGFFLYWPPNKLKLKNKAKANTQGKNSTFGRTFPLMCKTQKKTPKSHEIFPQNSKFSKGWHFLCHFMNKYFQKQKIAIIL